MDKERLDFHTALVDKIKSWEGTEDFSAGSTNRQKLNRSLNLLLGTNPDVLVDYFDIDTVPDDPREAMNLIRGADLKTLKDMEIFQLKGLGKKLVGHHEVAANTLGVHLNKMSPKDRLDVYKGMLDLGQKHGMDPRQIMLIPDSVHKSLAHGGDFTGKKTGALMPVLIGESGSDFIKRFENSINLQLKMAQEAVDAPVTQDWYRAVNTVEEKVGLPKGYLLSGETPLEVKGAASSFLQPTAEPVRKVVDVSGDIAGDVGKIITETQLSKKKFDKLSALTTKYGGIKLDSNLLNLRAFGVGSAAGLLTSEEAMSKIREGDVVGGVAAGATEAAVGEATAQVAQRALPKLGAVGRAVAPVAKAIGPASMVATPAKAISEANTYERVKAAQERGGKLSFGFGGVKLTLPELGVTEALGGVAESFMKQ